MLGNHVTREPERRVNDGIGVSGGGEAIAETLDNVGPQEPAKTSGVLQGTASGFDESPYQPVRIWPSDGMEREATALDELPERRPGRYRYQVAGPL